MLETKLKTQRFAAEALLPNQGSLWFFDQLHPSSYIYNIPAGFRVTGPVDMDRLTAATAAVLKRHEMLSLTFPSNANGLPAPAIRDFELEHIPAFRLKNQTDQEVEAQILSEARQPFDIKSGPLYRPVLWILNEQETILQLTIHHIVADGWSIKLILKDLIAHYENGSLDSKPKRVSDFQIATRAWRDLVESPEYQDRMAYWKRQLDGAPFALEIPVDRKRPDYPTFDGDRKAISLDQPCIQALLKLSRQSDVSLFTMAMAAFHLFVYRLSGRKDNVLGFLSSGRDLNTHSLVGYFANLLPLRIKIDEEMTFRELLATTAIKINDAASNEIPFNAIVEMVDPHLEIARNPISQAIVLQTGTPSNALRSGETIFEFFTADKQKAKFDLSLLVNERGDDFDLELEFSRDVYDDPTITRFASHFATLLESISRQADQPLSK